MEPLNVSRENFPKSTETVEGMQIINPICDLYELNYEYDVAYREVNDRTLYLQLIKPINAGTKIPAILFIPGSAFHRQNVKERVAQLAMLAVKGYFVALLEYTGSEDGAFPQFVLDAKAGVVFLKEHAAEYGIDKENIFVMGDSSGAYTALMTGLTNSEKSLEDETSGNYDYSVRGIIDFYGPTDITTMNNVPPSQDHRTADSPEGLMLGGFQPLERPDLSEPTIIKNYLKEDKTYPPVIMFHGSNDELVPFSQSCELFEAFKRYHVDALLYQMEGAHHGDRQFWSSEILDMIDNFIKENLCYQQEKKQKQF